MTDALRHPLSPRLDHCPEGLPRAAYLEQAWFDQEQATIFATGWVMVGRLEDFGPGTLTRASVGTAPVIIARDTGGRVAAWHNHCPHRGAELCADPVQPLGQLIRCPYHAFAFVAMDGRLVTTGYAVPTEDFDRSAYGLRPVAARVWNGFLFLSQAADPGPIWSDVGLDTLDNWPMAELVTGYRHETVLDCNWKVFWENYSECLHCPGVHPELCDLVPVYRTGVMGPSEALGWTPDQPETPPLRAGAATWTVDGAPCGPVFPRLNERERQAGFHFVTLWPSAYVVAHVDHVRSVRIVAEAPERTRLVVEWHFPLETIGQPGFNAENVAAFAKAVLRQDGEAAEMNQRGLRSPAFKAARLMPEEYEVHRFHRWVLAGMEIST